MCVRPYSFIMFLFIVFIPDAFAALFSFSSLHLSFFFFHQSSRSQLNRKDQRTLEPMRTRIFKEDGSASAISYLRVRHSREGNARTLSRKVYEHIETRRCLRYAILTSDRAYGECAIRRCLIHCPIMCFLASYDK